MSDVPAGASDDRSEGVTTRLFGAVELIASAHASRAKEEATRDVSRIASGALLIALAVALVMPALFLASLAAVLLLEDQARLGFPTSAAVVACIDLVLALAIASAGRARLTAPVLQETRATLKRAATVLRGV